MKRKSYKIVFGVFLALLTVSLMSFSLTWARYSKDLPSGGIFSGEIDYIVSDQIEVETSEDFFSAIENGYSNIKIADDVNDPILITGGVSDVYSDLTIDLNGHELQRNNREPMLNVSKDVRLTIIDSSAKKTGCFYNPVGDVLRISGGTLTVTGGIFESGPRNGVSLRLQNSVYGSEYAAYAGSGNNAVWKTPAGASMYEHKNQRKEVTYYQKNGTEYTETKQIVPIILPHVVQNGVDSQNNPRYAVNGNMYFSVPASELGMQMDTYLYFTIQADNVENTRIAASNGSADFYYTYFMEQSANGLSFSYAKDQTPGEGRSLVTVYGYREVKASVNDSDGFAAINMNAGNLYVRGGNYTSYFGVENTACVDASGGYMAVESGAFEALDRGTCVNIAYRNPGEREYLRVQNGDFYSQAGDTVRVQNGTMSVTGGSFNKDASGFFAETAGGNNAIISIGGGTLTVAGSMQNKVDFNLKGSFMYGVESVSSAYGGGTIEVSNADFTFNAEKGDHTTNYGIYSQAGAVTVNGCTFMLPDQNSRGISIESGAVTVNGCGGESDTNTYSYFYLDEAVGCYGVYARTNGSEKAAITMNAAQIFVGQGTDDAGEQNYNRINGAGIYMNAGNQSKVSLRAAAVIASGNSVSGIYVQNGNIEQTNGNLVIVTGAKVSNYQSGITHFKDLETGYGVNVSEGTREITDLVADRRILLPVSPMLYNYGVFGSGGWVRLNSVYAAVYGDYTAGLLTQGANSEIIVQDTMAMRVVGTGRIEGERKLSSTGISTENGNIQFKKGADIRTEYGLGITARNGDIVFDGGTDKENEIYLTTSQGTAIFISGGTLNIGSEENFRISAAVDSTIDGNYSWAMPPESEGTVLSSYQSDGIFVQGGSLKSYGTLKINHRGISNDGRSSRDTFLTQKIKSFAVRVEETQMAAADVIIRQGEIVNEIGGGVYAGGGIVSLGYKNISEDLLQIKTLGNITDNQYHADSAATDVGSWPYQWSITGGHAVEVAEGNLTIFGGSFNSLQGNGILVRGGSAIIQNGTFSGNDAYQARDGRPAPGGPAASYAFKVVGGAANIQNGDFTSEKGSGAFVMGTPSSMGTATVEGGIFDTNGMTGFSVYRYANVSFVPQNGSDIYVSGQSSGMSVEDNLPIADGYDSQAAGSTVTIHGGTFEDKDGGDGFGIYYAGVHDTFTVSGNPVIRGQVCGLSFAVMPQTGKVSLFGGVFFGAENNVSESWGRLSNSTTINAIDGQNISYRAILSGNANAVGYTKGDESGNEYGGTVSDTLTDQNIKAKGTWSSGRYSVDVCYVKVIIQS